MKLYFISIRSKEDGYLVPSMTDANHVHAVYKDAMATFPDGAVFVREAVMDELLGVYRIGKEVDINSI